MKRPADPSLSRRVLRLALPIFALLAACAPLPDPDPTPAPAACATGEAMDERGRCVPAACAEVAWGSEEGALHVALWGDVLSADGSPEAPFRGIGSALAAARERPESDRRVFVDVGTWAEPVLFDGLLEGTRLVGRCRDGVVLTGRHFSQTEVLLLGGVNPVIGVLGARGIEVKSLTLTDGVRGILVADGGVALEDVLIHHVDDQGVSVIPGGDALLQRTVARLTDVHIRDTSRTVQWAACLVAEDADVVVSGLTVERCASAGMRIHGDASFSGEDVVVRDAGPGPVAYDGFGIYVSARARFGVQGMRIDGAQGIGLLTSWNGPPRGDCPAACEGMEVDGICPGLCLTDVEIRNVRPGTRTGGGIGIALQRGTVVGEDVRIFDTAGPGIYALDIRGELRGTRIERTTLAGIVGNEHGLLLSDLEVREVAQNPEYGGGAGYLSLRGAAGSPDRIEDAVFADLAGGGIYSLGTSLDLAGVRIERVGGPGVYAGIRPGGEPRSLTIDGLELDGVGQDGLLIDGPISTDLNGLDTTGVGWEGLHRQRCGDAEATGQAAQVPCSEVWRETRPYLQYSFSVRESDLEP